MNILIIYTDYSTNKSIESYQSLSENQMFITKDNANTTIDSSLVPFIFKLDKENTGVYPYIQTQVQINDNLYQVVPLFEQNDLSHQKLIEYDSQSIYLSYYCYRELADNNINPESLEVSFVVSANNDLYKDTKTYPIGGVLTKNNKCHYFKGENRYVYCSFPVITTNL